MDGEGRVRALGLSRNALSGPIPPELGNLANLTWLYLGGNQLSGPPIPPELGNLANLTSLGLDNNALSGPIPPELGTLANLTGSVPLGQPTLRPDSARTRQPRQPDLAVPRGQPTLRPDSARTRQPRQSDLAGAHAKQRDRDHPTRTRQTRQPHPCWRSAAMPSGARSRPNSATSPAWRNCFFGETV